MITYKVVEIKQKSFMKGVMTARDLQATINQYAVQGWELDRLNSGETQGFVGGKDVFLIIFRLKIDIPEGLHIMVNNQPVGPIDEKMLGDMMQNRGFVADTPACKKGMEGWQPLSVVAPKIVQAMFG